VITGTVTEEGVPTIMVSVADSNWPAIIDTGFNGDLELPNALRPFVNPRFVGRIRSVLAGNVEIEEDNYHVTFPFDDQTRVGQATFVSGSEILIGTHFLRQYRIEIDFHERTVLLMKSG
jgi:predicted aspartyl protease